MRILNIYDRIVLGHPRWVVGSLLILFAFFAFWIKDFRLDASADSLVLENDEDLRYSRSVSDRYGTDEFVVVTYRPSEDLFSAASLETLKKLRADLAALKRVSAVTTLLDVPLLRMPWHLFGLIFLGTLGIASVGAVFSGMLMRARSREILLSIALYPVILPVVIAGAKGTSLLFAPVVELNELTFWLKFLLVYDAVFITLSLWLFEPLLID